MYSCAGLQPHVATATATVGVLTAACLECALLYPYRCTCKAVAFSSQGRVSPDGSHMNPSASSSAAGHSKYDRILAFVDSQATPVVVDGWSSSSSGSAGGLDAASDAEVQRSIAESSWHHSYDEEADEGEELLHEPQLLARTVQSVAALPSAAAAAVQAATAQTWSYGSIADPKPFFYSWDEEAEGGFELATAACSSMSASASAAVVAEAEPAAAARAARRAAMHEARHAARLSRRMRRAQLHPQLGDLERMPAWVQPSEQQQQRSAANAHYQQLLAFVAGDSSTNGQYRKPKRWHLTFDEDVHGPEAPETVLGSC